MIRGEETVRDIGVPGCRDATEIGRGGFGVVYRARQPAISRTVAVKVLAADGLDVDARRRFEGEVRAMGRLGGHPHIVTVHQAGFTAGGNPYILMAYEDGGSLADRGPAGSWPEAVAGGITIAGALESAHRAGLLHRDVTPRNILFSRYGEPKLADFGLARPVRRTAAPRTVTATRPHAAPEILRGEAPTVASDVYALASTIRWWLGGPELRRRGVPEAVCATLDRATARDPAVRPVSAAALAEELQAAQRAAGRPVTALVVGGAGDTDDAGEDAPILRPRRRGATADALGLSATITQQPPRWRTPVRRAGAALLVAATLVAVGPETAPGMPVEVAAVDFGGHQTSAEALEKLVTVRNGGNRPTTVGTARLAGEDFRIVADGCRGHRLTPKTTCQLRLAFAPSGAGIRRATLRLPGRAVAVTGTGLLRRAAEDDPPPGACYPDAYQVGHTAYGYVGGQKAISVKQYWSPACRSVMAYTWVWKQYRDNAGTRGTWRVDLMIAGSARPHRALGQPLELWTTPVATPPGCSRATATMTGTGVPEPLTVTTDGHCP